MCPKDLSSSFPVQRYHEGVTLTLALVVVVVGGAPRSPRAYTNPSFCSQKVHMAGGGGREEEKERDSKVGGMWDVLFVGFLFSILLFLRSFL